MFSMGFGFYIVIRLDLGRIGRVGLGERIMLEMKKPASFYEGGLFLETRSGGSYE